MTRGEPEGNKPNVQDQEVAGGNSGGSVPPAHGGGDDGADAVHLADAQDAATGDAQGGAGGDAGSGSGAKVTDIKDLMEVAEVRDWLRSIGAWTVGLLKASVIRHSRDDGGDDADGGVPIDWKGGRYSKTLVDIHFTRSSQNVITDISVVPGFGSDAEEMAAKCALVV